MSEDNVPMKDALRGLAVAKGAPHVLRLRRMGIDTYQEPVIYMRADCPVCRSEGFAARSRVRLQTTRRELVATLNVVNESALLGPSDAGLSEIAWRQLAATEGETVSLSHPEPVQSFSHVRAKLYGQRLDDEAYAAIIADVAANRYTDVQLSAFLTACSSDRLDLDEVVALTRAMVGAGDRLEWAFPVVMDKHCVGGLPGNRTTPILV
ncbi:MAG TPA: thymidine phosphorylase, partial [Gammaproteobacteria bacterium]|nr:thymidine phosphorylase [Gammaproteobacteria bacterium]